MLKCGGTAQLLQSHAISPRRQALGVSTREIQEHLALEKVLGFKVSLMIMFFTEATSRKDYKSEMPFHRFLALLYQIRF